MPKKNCNIYVISYGKKSYYDMPFILRKAIDESSVITAKEKESFWESNDELWKDIIFYLEHKNFRRPQLWLSK